jgi:putative phosphotransacetylase
MQHYFNMKILCEVSIRHVHLSQNDLATLFGEGATMQCVRELSQPDQYLSDLRVDIVGPKRTIGSVAVLGPVRKQSQVEISQTDCFTLGLRGVPVCQSGNLDGTPGVRLQNGDKFVDIKCGVIVVQRHVHLDPTSAKKNNLCNGELVDLEFDGPRGGILRNAIVRVHPEFAPAVHIDSDEGNALLAGGTVTVIKK